MRESLAFSMRESLAFSMQPAFLDSNLESPSYEEQKGSNESDALLADHSNLNKHGSVADAETNAEPMQLLSMDHHYLTFFQFLWVEIFVSYNMRIRAAYGMVKLMICKPLYDRGWIDHTPDYNELVAKLVAKLVLETSFSEFYLGKKIDDNGNVIGGFFCADFPYIEQNTSTNEVACKIADVLSVDIDLTNKRMVKANLDDEDLNASEALTLIWGFMSQARHLQVHAFSNWGITVNEKHFEIDPFIARIVTINYNFLGFADRIPTFHALLPETLFCKEWNSEAISTIQNHGLSNMSWFNNPHLEDLYQYSDFVNFTEKLRPIFLEVFDGAKRIHFPGCNGDALFMATVFHSLEHTSGHWVFGDKSLFCFDTTHPRFGAGAQMGLLLEECFNQDLPFLTFHKRFKGSKHPFYECIYEEAVKLNKKLADEMDTCIIK